jgi:propanol-preferring alcohol dehydrogenase
VEAMGNLAPGGRLVVNAIRKEDADREYLLRLDYPRHLRMEREREMKSVANVSPRDMREFLQLAGEAALEPETTVYPLDEANRALTGLRSGGVRGQRSWS